MSQNNKQIRVNSKCPCGSDVKYKNCCKPYTRHGPLVKKLSSDFNDIHSMFIFEINTILQNLCIESIYLDKLYEAVIDLFSLSERALEDLKNHTYGFKDGAGVTKNGNTWCVDDFDQRMNFYIRHLFIDGGIVKDALIKLSSELGFNISFLFGKDEPKDFQSKIDKLAAQFTDQGEASKLVAYIKKEKRDWIQDFVIARNDIEHGVFKIGSVDYLVNKFDKLLPQYPMILKKHSVEIFQDYPIKFLGFSRQTIIFLLGELAGKEKFSEGVRGILIETTESSIPWGKLNKDKKTFKMTLFDEKTQQILGTNFSRSCPKKTVTN